ncbi:MAG: prepilin peptidase [Myxococcales bacterium]|nr:prepilin peptidase [Myxococcales bacterium]
MLAAMDPLIITVYLFILAWGAVWGSFLNVVIWRVPNGMSVVSPPSHCPKCSHGLSWWQNVPVFGWVWLGGRCHFCKVPISPRYPAVEAVTAVLAVAVAMPWVQGWLSGDLEPWRAGLGMASEHFFVFACISIALIDADTFMIPDPLSLPLPLLGIALAVVLGEERGVLWQEAAAAALVAGGGLLAVQWGYAALTGREGLGTGDVKLLAGLGAWLGLGALPAVLLSASLMGLLFAASSALLSRGSGGTEGMAASRGLASMRHVALPFGPFLVLGGLGVLLLRRQLAPVLAPLFGG